MAIRHRAICDWDGCLVDVPARVVASTPDGRLTMPTYTYPEGWIQMRDWAFCSWACVAGYAGEQVSAD
jgi:hypothetical protein